MPEKRLHVENLAIDGVAAALTTVPPGSETPSELSLSPPLDIVLDRLTLTGAKISQDGKPLFSADRLDLAGAWTHAGIAVKQLALHAPNGSVDVAGTLATINGYSGQGNGRFRWQVDQNTYAGTLKSHSDGKRAALTLVLTAPMPATLTTTLEQNKALPWTLKLDAPRFDANKLLPDSKLQSLALALQGSGNRDQGSIDGEVTIDAHRVQLAPLSYALAGQTLKITALTLKSAEIAGSLDITRNIRLDAKPLSATATLAWNDVQLPADLAGQMLATHGKLAVAGSTDDYRAEGEFAIGPPGKPANIALKLDGTPQTIALEQLTLQQAEGGLDAHGTLALQPALRWQLEATAKRFDPGAFAAAWPGALD
ncbi:MAG: translocation/assembly module TamB domain-containing protein, partial [Vulcanimicrobiaceae bacterium]